MKSTYTKRVLAFWLAVAMVATGAPAAFAVGSSTTDPAPMITTGLGGTPETKNTDVKKVTITKGEVAVDGKTAPEGIAVHAFSDADGQPEITQNIKWAVSTTDGGQDDVTVGENGVVTVSARAKEGTYTITPSVNDQSADLTATLKVTRTGENVATNITVAGGVGSVTIPGDSDSAVTVDTAFTASVKNAFDEYVNSPKVTWSVEPQLPDNSGKVSITDGKVTVQPGAVEDSITVKATSGSVSGTTTFTLAYAAKTIKTFDEI